MLWPVGSAVKETRAQSFFEYPWKIGETCRFVVKAKTENGKTAYSSYFWLTEKNSWKHLVTFRTQSDGDLLEKGCTRSSKISAAIPKALLDHKATRSATERSSTLKESGTHLAKARFTASGAEWEAKDTIDAGLHGDLFYLATGGETKMNRTLNSLIDRPPAELKPPELPIE